MKKLYSKAKHIMLLFLWLAGSFSVLAQDRTVSGTVKDEDGSGLPGVNVIVAGTSNGTVTDISGKYSISVGSGSKLLFSFIGFTSQEAEIGNSSVVDVSMKVDITELQEIVVTGYASQEKKDLTGAVGTVKMSELLQVPSSNVTNQLQGRIAGVTVSGDGRPGQPAKVRIRGFGSFGNNDPLYVVDGVPTQDISTINPGDIESLSVLKDAGAASIYGSRGANGVVIVTTKKGDKSGIKVNYDMYVGSQDPGKKPDFLLDTQGMADAQWLVYKNDEFNGSVDKNPVDGILDSEIHPFYGSSANANPTLPSWAANTDWYKLLTRKALIMNHDLSMSGGNENAKFYAGLNYFNQEGIVITNFSKRVSARINSEFKIKDRVTIGENLTVTGRTGLGLPGTRDEGSPFAGIYNTQPIIPARITQTTPGIARTYQPGEYGGSGISPRLGNTRNRLAELERNADDRSQDVRVLGNVFVDVKIFDFLSFRSTFGGTFQNGYNTDWNGVTYENAENIATSTYNENAYFNSDWVWTNQLTFDKTFGSHKVLAVAGYESVKYGIGRGLSATRAGYFSEAFSFRTLNNGATIQSATSGFNTPTTLVSQFVRGDYSFSDKYLLSATVRRDGSSRFGQNNRYGVFPSVSAGWRISEEAFMSGLDFVSDFKIRGGYGTLGNQLSINPSNNFFLFGGSVGDSNYDLNGTGTSSLQGFRPTQAGNVDGKWETNTTTNIGFDAGFFDNKLQVSFDWYNKQTKDLLYQRPLPGTDGALSPAFVNLAEMSNRGIDIQIGYKKVISSDLTIDGNLTFTAYKNEIVGLAPNVKFFDDGGSRIGSFNRNAVGNPVSAFFGYQVIGLFQTAAEVTGAPTQDGAEAGFFRYANVDASNNIIDADDRTFIGDPNPDFTYGLNLTVTYKNFDLSTFFYGSQGNDIFNYNKWWNDFWPSFQNQKSPNLLNNSWTPERTDATTPKASAKSNFSTNTQSTSYYVEDGSFLRLRNLQVGYNIPSGVVSKIGLSRARLYVQGVNLFTFTNYSGLDPDLNSGGDTAFGVDEGNYPLVKQYILGVNIGF